MTTGFRWIKPPSTLTQAVEQYQGRVLVAVQAVASRVGKQMQDDARLHVPWQDRTGAARGGLFFAVDGLGLEPIVGEVTPEAEEKRGEMVIESGSADVLILSLGHTVYYGKFLETAHGAKYAIVMSTIEAHLPELEKLLQELFGEQVTATAHEFLSIT